MKYSMIYKDGWFYVYENDKLKYCFHNFADAIKLIQGTI